MRRQVQGFTIDGETSKDLDDAIWIESSQDTVVQIHIADVAKQVAHRSFLDQRAYDAGQTIYLRQGNRPMLPRSLSEDRCSLLPGQARDTITIAIHLDQNLEIVDVELFESQLVSLYQFTYSQADQEIAAADRQITLLQQKLRELWAFCQKLSLRRHQTGALFGSQMGDYYLDEDGRLIEQPYRSQQIIAELMILANWVVGDRLAAGGYPGLYRNHEPSAEPIHWSDLQFNYEELKSLFGNRLAKARYEAEGGTHFGLQLQNYLHFTSPIRRYSDLVNHRIVKALIQAKPSPYSETELAVIASHLNHLIEAQNTARVEHLKAKALRDVHRQVETSGLQQLGQKEFSVWLGERCKDGRIWEYTPELERRLAHDQLTLLDLYELLFLAPEPSDFSSRVLAWFQQHSSDAAMLLNILNQKHCPATCQIEALSNSDFQALWVVTLAEIPQSATHWSVGVGKAAAKGAAAIAFLSAWLNKSLVPTDQALPHAAMAPSVDSGINQEQAATDEITPDHNDHANALQNAPTTLEAAASDNYVGVLNNWAAQQNLAAPAYNFTPIAGAGFQCECSFQGLSGTGSAARKKLAKQEAAKACWLQLQAGSEITA
ncbi:MAG: RNB domain-containing ribonuclease [Cyanobacteria bacterium P01_H01_bin.121]